MAYSTSSNLRELTNYTRWGYYDGKYFNGDRDFDFSSETDDKNKISHYIRELVRDFMEHFDSLQEDNLLADVIFISSNGQTQRYASKQMLTARSACFEKLLNDESLNELYGITKGEEENGRVVLSIPDKLNFGILDILLDYIYWGYVNLKEERVIGRELELFEWTCLLDLKELRKTIADNFALSFTHANIIEFLKLGKKWECRHLKRHAFDYVTKHKSQVLSTPEWNRLINSDDRLENADLIKDIYKYMANKV